MYLISLDTLKTITKGFRYFATKHIGNKVLIMNDVGTRLWMNKNHFKVEV